MKKIIYILVAFLSVILIHLSLRFILNEIYISKYNNEDYSNGIVNFLQIINYPESYIAHYNKGNNLYKTGDYESAEKEYIEALKTVRGDRRCKVEINLAFTKLELAADKTNNTIDVEDLRKIQEVLLDSDCATKDNKGTNKDAQRLYNEIEEMIKNAKGNGNGNDDPNNDPNDDPDPNDQPQDYSDLEQKIREQQQAGQKERQDKINPREYEYYNGKTW